MSQPFLYPNVTSIPNQSGITKTDRAAKKSQGSPGEFDQIFDQTLTQVRSPLKFSAHAMQRLRERNIGMDPKMLSKINDAVDKAEAKGVEDTLILTPDAALIINVSNRTVVTALDRKSAVENVFTNIDGVVLVQ